MPSYFFIIQFVYNDLNISTIIKVLLLLYNQSLRLFSIKILKLTRFLLIISKASLKEIFNINKKNLQTRYYISSIFNLSY